MTRRMTVTRNGETTQSEPTVSISPFELLNTLIRRKRVIVGAVIGTMFLTAGITLLVPNQYISNATVLPSGGTDKMADLKSLAGLSGMTGQDENSSELFPVILASNTIRDAVLAETYVYTDDDRPASTTLPKYFEQDNPDKLRAALAAITTVRHDKKTGVISIGVETEHPSLSQAVLARYIDELEAFNLHKRRSQAGERALYLERELTQRKAELAVAEDSLAAFQASNRDWMTSGSPEVAMLLNRLQREVETRNQTYLYLVQEFEIAKLDARKDVPVVRILDAPSLPTEKASPKRAMIVLLLGMVAGVVAVFGVLVAEALKRASTGPDREEFTTLKESIAEEFPRVNRLLSRVTDQPVSLRDEPARR